MVSFRSAVSILTRVGCTLCQYSDSFRPGPGDITLMVAIAKNGGALSLHYGAFLPTLLSQVICFQTCCRALHWCIHDCNAGDSRATG